MQLAAQGTQEGKSAHPLLSATEKTMRWDFGLKYNSIPAYWVVGGRLRRARLLTGGSKREFGEELAVGAVTTARAVEEAEAVVDRRGRAGLRLRRPSVGPAL